MLTIYVLTFEPDADYGTVGGFDWYLPSDAARLAYRAKCDDPDYRHDILTLWEVQVLKSLSDQEIAERIAAIWGAGRDLGKRLVRSLPLHA